MMEYPPITIAITTMDRVELLDETIQRLYQYVSYPGKVYWVFGNDGQVEPLAKLVDCLDFAEDVTLVGTGHRRGLGANTNAMLAACQTDIVFQTQDDYWLCEHLELAPHVEKLLTDESAGWIRLRLLRYQDFTATVDGDYWRVSWFSQGLYIASDQPHLKHMRFHRHFGMYQEGLDLPNTENEWCGRVKNTGQQLGGPAVLIPCDWRNDSSWRHMGDEISWKRFGY